MADNTEDTVYRPRYEQVDASDVRPAAATARRRQEEIDRAGGGTQASSSAPEDGPYGPNADYETVDAPADRDHTSPHQPKE